MQNFTEARRASRYRTRQRAISIALSTMATEHSPTVLAQPNSKTISRIVPGSIPNGDIRVEFADDSYNPDKHFDAKGVPSNSTDLYTWHWDNIEIYTGKLSDHLTQIFTKLLAATNKICLDGCND